MTTTHTAFVMEQALGHVTHAHNLQSALQERSDITPTWLPIQFGVTGAGRLMPLLRSNWSVRASWRARRALNVALASRRPDALVFHTQVTALFSVGLMRRIPSVVSLDATPINYDEVGEYYRHKAAGSGLIDRQKYRMNRDVFHAAHTLVTWSNWARDSLTHDYAVDPARIQVLAPGAADRYFKLGARRVESQATTTSSRRARVLFVGGDFTRKGGHLLLDCMQGLLSDTCELHLVTNQHVEPRPNVYMHSGLTANSPELVRLFAEADMFVLPSHAECLAVVLMEATAAALPVITTRVGGLAEAVQPGCSGFLMHAGDGSALRNALETLAADAGLRERMGRAGYELAKNKFDADRNNGALLDLVVEAAAAHTPIRRVA
jgi:glycosyltransferase involved in cell wall biosynthesis